MIDTKITIDLGKNFRLYTLLAKFNDTTLEKQIESYIESDVQALYDDVEGLKQILQQE